MNQRRFFTVLCLAGIGLFGCSGFDNILNEPLIITQPATIDWMTPERIQLKIPLKVENSNPVTLRFSRGIYTLTMDGHKIVERTLAELPMVPGYNTRLIDILIQLELTNLKNISDQKTPREFQISGFLYPDNELQKNRFSFYGTSSVAIPLLPVIEKMSKKISKASRKNVVLIKVNNPNSYPLMIEQVRGYLQANGRKYPLSLGNKPVTLAGEQALVLPARIETTEALGASGMMLNGELELTSPSGKIILPLPSALPWPEKSLP